MNYVKIQKKTLVSNKYSLEEKCFIIQCNNDIKTLLTKLKKVKYMSFMLVEKIEKQVY